MIKINLIIGFFLMLTGWHPFHAAVTDLVYKEESKSVQIMHKVFVDDFEQTLNRHYEVSLDILAMNDTRSIDSLLRDYLSQRFFLTIDGKEQELTYIGSELEDNVLWIYQEAYKVRKPQEFQVTNRVLFDEFDDQSNLVHTSVKGEIKSMRLVGDRDTDQVTFTYY